MVLMDSNLELNYLITNMTRLKPYLFINRLVIISHQGKVAYDEKFHTGVSIIRGENSSGKSTIANFLFYSLGGEYKNWTNQAKECEEVYVEINANDTILTLKRLVKDIGKQPMSIFWGDFESSQKSNFEGWLHFPYSQTANMESFSTVLFNVLGFPEVRNESDSKITMNQILRLIFIDQESPNQSLFKSEIFDLPITREAISELLLGVYDNSLYNDRLDLRMANQEYKQKKDQFDSISKIFGFVEGETDVTKIYKELEATRNEINKIDDEILKTRERATITLRKTTPLNIETLQQNLAKLKTQISEILTERKDVEFDIADSVQFIEVLEKRIIALNDSIATRGALGELPLEYCPHCLLPLDSEAQEGHCNLCKQHLPEDLEKNNASRLKQEIELQIKESKKLLDIKNKNLLDLTIRLEPLIEKLRSIQREIDIEEKETRTTRDTTLDNLLVRKGGLEGQINYLTKQLTYVEQLNVLKKEIQELSSKISELNLNIKLKQEQQNKNLRNAHEKIEELTIKILRKDLGNQNEFDTGNSVEINFLKDSFTLEGGNNFSASSNTYFKNAVRFAIFFASLELPFFRYPRLIICDNIEDKGMEEIRSRNFQKVIVELSESYEIEHQIIFTTSMIEPELNNKTYCIGRQYTKISKSLMI